MKVQEIKALDLELALEDNEFLHDEGIVTDLEKWKYLLDAHYDEVPLPIAVNTVGHCGQYRWGNETHVHLAYLDQFHRHNNIFVHAHELGHGLTILNKDQIIVPKLKEFGFTGNFAFLNKEMKADIFGIYALMKEGLRLCQAYEAASKKFQIAERLPFYFSIELSKS